MPKMQLRKNTHLESYLKSFRSKMVSAKLNGRNFPPVEPKPASDRDVSWFGRRAPTSTDWGVELKNFPPGMSSAPFLYKDVSTGKKHKMAFMGGVATLVQRNDKHGALEPRMGWAVLDSGTLAK